MKALAKTKTEPGIWMIDAPKPEIGPKDVLVKVHKTGICGTDIHIYNWDDWAKSVIPVPMVTGHEFSGEIAALKIPAFHSRPSAPTNLTLHEAIDINVPIGCGDAAVFPGDVIVGDADGVMVIPAEIADEIATEAVEMTAFEDFVTEQVLGGRSIKGLYPATDPQTKVDFEAWRKQKGR